MITLCQRDRQGLKSMAPAPPSSGVTLVVSHKPHNGSKVWQKNFQVQGVLAQAGLRALDERLESPADLAYWAGDKLG